MRAIPILTAFCMGWLTGADVYAVFDRGIPQLRYLRGTYPRRKHSRQVVRYFRRNRKRMDYARPVERPLPIRSGVPIAACKRW